MTRYRIDIEAARRRLAAREHHSIQTPYGSVQYAEHGQGPPLLFSHPLVGGFDVGLGCAESWIGDGFRVIAPSRFGYLGSSLPPGVMPADQADAYALLLDALGIERAAIVGYSAGGPSVIQFALRHPDRTSGLILLCSALPGKAGGPPRPVARLLVTDSAGQVHAEFPIPPGGRGYRLQAAWSDRSQQWTLTTQTCLPQSFPPPRSRSMSAISCWVWAISAAARSP